MKIAIGTAQFGSNYGISNRTGQVSIEEVRKIFAAGRQLGIEIIDTAQAYGEAEQVIGKDDSRRYFRIVSKTFPLNGYQGNIANIVDESLNRLKLPDIYAIMAHHSKDVLGKNGAELTAALRQAKELGKVQKIGVSVYEPSDLDAVTEKFDIDIVQIPANILDQRFFQSGWLDRLAHKGIEVHIRSLFLQGLLLLSSAQRPAWANDDALEEFDRFCATEDIDPLTVCLAAYANLSQVSAFVIGCENSGQLEAIVSAYHAAKKITLPLEKFSCANKSLILPSLWPRS